MSIVYILHLSFKQISYQNISLSKCILKKDLVIGEHGKFYLHESCTAQEMHMGDGDTVKATDLGP